MSDQSRKQLRRATIVFWVLLLYIIVALVWWYFQLEQQNRELHTAKREEVHTSTGIYKDKQTEIDRINNREKRNSTKYITEGITFLLLIIFGAVYIYRLVRQQFRMQQQQQNFLMAVTHELKTPISVARLNLETLQKHQLEEERQKKMLQMTIHETMRLDTLINNILLSAQLEGDAYKTQKEELDLSSLVMDVLNQFRARYPDRKLKSIIEPDIEFTGDPLLLKLLLSNLLENANKYSEKTRPVTCRLSFANNSQIDLSVADEGTGIPDREKKRIYWKFYRMGNEEIRKTKGTGLGLYICKKIVQSHKGKIRITDNAPQGSIFTVTFKTKQGT